MPDLAVPRDQRPSIAKYVAYTALGFVVVGSFLSLLAGNTDNGAVAVGAVIVGALLNLGVLFLMVQSLIEEWFAAAEVVDR